MPKLKLTGTDGHVLSKTIPSIKGVRPAGMQVLVELLTPQEIIGTTLHVGEDANIGGAPQGYVLDIGPKLEKQNEESPCGFERGSRVILSGSFTPLPECDQLSNRPLAVVEPHCIKAVLLEE